MLAIAVLVSKFLSLRLFLFVVVVVGLVMVLAVVLVVVVVVVVVSLGSVCLFWSIGHSVHPVECLFWCFCLPVGLFIHSSLCLPTFQPFYSSFSCLLLLLLLLRSLCQAKMRKACAQNTHQQQHSHLRTDRFTLAILKSHDHCIQPCGCRCCCCCCVLTVVAMLRFCGVVVVVVVVVVMGAMTTWS